MDLRIGEWIPWASETSVMKRLRDDFIVYLSRNWSDAPGKYVGTLFRQGKVVKKYECLSSDLEDAKAEVNEHLSLTFNSKTFCREQKIRKGRLVASRYERNIL